MTAPNGKPFIMYCSYESMVYLYIIYVNVNQLYIEIIFYDDVKDTKYLMFIIKKKKNKVSNRILYLIIKQKRKW